MALNRDGEVMDKVKLVCKIDWRTPCVFSHDENIHYSVYDGEEVVAQGISSSESWVKNDAGGYHTKEKFDEKYPNGWEVTYSF